VKPPIWRENPRPLPQTTDPRTPSPSVASLDDDEGARAPLAGSRRLPPPRARALAQYPSASHPRHPSKNGIFSHPILVVDRERLGSMFQPAFLGRAHFSSRKAGAAAQDSSNSQAAATAGEGGGGDGSPASLSKGTLGRQSEEG
jgi:hypothetical protein